ncbi:hypothetical protein NOR_00860 [Metarhizium rileyi]|uniref:Uncharacterized protein n=1 Tax=Metarhizium rileyi (strain RCEF 4871) TaxID=1649241 RepID=A0A162M489_METRR|nr:hypothetical protein NOR_00860 [Metarhizium rileyi RCEF 4871]
MVKEWESKGSGQKTAVVLEGVRFLGFEADWDNGRHNVFGLTRPKFEFEEHLGGQQGLEKINSQN